MQPDAMRARPTASRRRLVANRVLAVLALAGAAAAGSLAFLTHAPNRLVTGTGIPLAALPLAELLPMLLPASWLVAAALLPPSRALHLSVLAAAAMLIAALLWIAGAHADALAANAAALSRTSFGGAFWMLVAVAALAFADGLQRLRLPPAWRACALLVAAIPAIAVVASGALDQLALAKEYSNRRDVFAAAVWRHVEIVAATLLPALAAGIPLGVAAYRSERLRAPLLAVLNIVQTVPSIALFGLLLAPLAWLAASVPVLSRWGVSGVGLAPAVIALALYALLPVVRSTVAGLGQVPQPVRDAAAGMGMTARQAFWRVEAPMALPVVLAGARVATVQTVGLAVVAALIGAGGLGAIVFQGLLSSALDLVILGVVPVVGMAVVADALFALLSARLSAYPR